MALIPMVLTSAWSTPGGLKRLTTETTKSAPLGRLPQRPLGHQMAGSVLAVSPGLPFRDFARIRSFRSRKPFMFSPPTWVRASAIAVAFLAHSQAEAHAVCGNRIFPATLAIDDPGVSDELALPTMTYLPKTRTAFRRSTRRSATQKPSFPIWGFPSPMIQPGSSLAGRVGETSTRS